MPIVSAVSMKLVLIAPLFRTSMSRIAHHSDQLTSTASSQQFHGRICTLTCPGQHRHQVCVWRIQLRLALVLACNSSDPCCTTLPQVLYVKQDISPAIGFALAPMRCSYMMPSSYRVQILKRNLCERLVWTKSSAGLGPVQWRSSMRNSRNTSSS